MGRVLVGRFGGALVGFVAECVMGKAVCGLDGWLGGLVARCPLVWVNG